MQQLIDKRIKELRINNDLTQKDLAIFLGLTPKMISFYELGQRTPPSDIILKLAEKFNVSTDYLLGNSNDIFPTDPNQQAKQQITDAISDDKELLEFWNDLKESEDLKLLFKQTKSLSPATIKRVIKYIKMVEDEEMNED